MKAAVLWMIMSVAMVTQAQKKPLASESRFKNGLLSERKEYSPEGFILRRTFYLRYLDESKKIEETYEYKSNKLIASEIKSASDSAVRIEYTYDSVGLLSGSRLLRAGQEISIENFLYDSKGNMSREILKQGRETRVVQYKYDSLEHKLEKTVIIDSVVGTILEKKITFFTDFDSLSQTQTQHADGTLEVVYYVYDQNERLIEKTIQLNGAVLSIFRYTYRRDETSPLREYQLNPEGYIVMEKKNKYKRNELLIKTCTTDYRVWGFEDNKNKRIIETYKYEYYK